MDDDGEAIREVALTRVAAAGATADRDAVACEEPLEIQVRGVPVAVLMRTPGHDEELARGFLVTERIVRAADEITAVRHCRVIEDPAAEDNVIAVSLRGDVALDLEALRRNLFTSASCGICGKATIDQALAVAPPLDDPTRVAPATVRAVMTRLAAAQPVFAATGGLHGAGLFTADGALRVVREDVGRHNAVDKVVGWTLARGPLPLAGHILAVSGRISFEIAQKALAARIPIVAAVSAPTSLAVDLAERAGMTLVGFARGDRFNVYGERERIGPRERA
ncbi:MAG TPA: formate dehydrogenase accessory sulfurtransferase FdhD [Candidatus Dormibacteraeota bacterium]|nr:formate dehydrogenase accessory sulfurtransferase FdhD [Candidatus Dormibacteraeota bacterium]